MGTVVQTVRNVLFVCRAENRIAGWEYSPVRNLPSRCLLRMILSTDIKVSMLSFTDR